MKKYIKWSILLLLILFLIHIGFVFLFGGIEYKGTFLTKYEKRNKLQNIITQHFEIVTPKNWIHIFRGYGEAIAAFLTKSGKLEYEYGIFSNPFNIDSIFVFSRDSIITNRFIIYVGKNDNNESGICIPRQHEMEYPFSILMSQACSD